MYFNQCWQNISEVFTWHSPVGNFKTIFKGQWIHIYAWDGACINIIWKSRFSLQRISQQMLTFYACNAFYIYAYTFKVRRTHWLTGIRADAHTYENEWLPTTLSFLWKTQSSLSIMPEIVGLDIISACFFNILEKIPSSTELITQ